MKMRGINTPAIIIIIGLIITATLIGITTYLAISANTNTENQETLRDSNINEQLSNEEICQDLDLQPFSCLIKSDTIKVQTTEKISGDLINIKFTFQNSEGEKIFLTDANAQASYSPTSFLASLVNFLITPVGRFSFPTVFLIKDPLFSPPKQTFEFSRTALPDVKSVSISGILSDNYLCQESETIDCNLETTYSSGGGGGGSGGGGGGGGSGGGDEESTCGNGIIEGNEECDDGNQDSGDGCSANCLEEQDCTVPGLTILSDFDESTCSRTRAGFLNSEIEKIPAIGFHSIGPSNLDESAAIGTKFHRTIVNWEDIVDQEGNLKSDLIAQSTIDNYLAKDVKILLTIRPNHPDKVECGDEAGGGISGTDSYPINEQEWKDLIKSIINEYYIDEDKRILAGIQLGNEWGHQYAIKIQDECVDDLETYAPQMIDSIINLADITYQAMQEAQEGMDKKLPLIAFGLTGPDSFALKSGFNQRDQIYTGFLDNGITIKTSEDINQEFTEEIERWIIESAPYYDYLDIHLRTNYPDEHGYTASWIRDLWKQNNIQGKGLISTEYAGPFHFYTTEYHEYFLQASLSNSYLQGFDSIAWAPWTPAKNLKINFGLVGMIDWNGNPRQYAQDGYQTIAQASEDFYEVQYQDGLYKFLDEQGNLIGEIDVNQDIEIPTTYEQCQDSLDNDQDSFIDDQDNFCGQGSFAIDVEFQDTGIYF